MSDVAATEVVEQHLTVRRCVDFCRSGSARCMG